MPTSTGGLGVYRQLNEDSIKNSHSYSTKSIRSLQLYNFDDAFLFCLKLDLDKAEIIQDFKKAVNDNIVTDQI